MYLLKSCAIAFSMYSKIPMPRVDWNEKNMRYAMCTFPLIGVVIGAAWCVCGALPLPGLAKAAGFALVPVWVTGGIHLDGYADTCDALSASYSRPSCPRSMAHTSSACCALAVTPVPMAHTGS